MTTGQSLPVLQRDVARVRQQKARRIRVLHSAAEGAVARQLAVLLRRELEVSIGDDQLCLVLQQAPRRVANFEISIILVKR